MVGSFTEFCINLLGVESICKVLQIAPSGCWSHALLKRAPHKRCAHVQCDVTFLPHIRGSGTPICRSTAQTRSGNR